jgi:hypothetical protein
MRKLLLSMGTFAIVALALVSGVTTARPAYALCYCETTNDYSTAQNWGFGSSCSAAQSDLASKVNAEAVGTCGTLFQTCLGPIHYTNSCWFNGSQYQSDGYRDYSCKTCGPPHQ